MTKPYRKQTVSEEHLSGASLRAAQAESPEPVPDEDGGEEEKKEERESEAKESGIGEHDQQDTRGNVVDIAVSSMSAGDDYQPRQAGISPAHLDSLMASDPATWPPLLVTPAHDGSGGFVVIDGNHRLLVARQLGVQALPCIVDPAAGAVEAFTANHHHGLALTLADRRAFVVWLSENEPQLSQREIAQLSGLSQPTVARIQAGVRAAGDATESSDQSSFGENGTTADYARRVVRALSAFFDNERALFAGATSERTEARRARLLVEAVNARGVHAMRETARRYQSLSTSLAAAAKQLEILANS